MSGNMIGRVLNNRYEITERVGIGGMAEVYRAHDTVLDRIVAVKVMLPQYAADPTFTQRFRQEAASAAKLQSPYIVSIYDWGLDDETYYIVMEFLRGTDLKTAIQQRGAINQRKVAEIGAQIAQALSVAHQGGIIHRDIKPQNIMIQPDGNIKVMDFGIARAGDAGLSQTSTVLGTAHYVSPEQAQGKELTGSSDIYSLGIVLYEAATGVLPFEGSDAVSVAVKQVNEQPKPPREINPDISPSLEAIILCAMDKNPENRFATAADMRRALNDFLAGRPVTLPSNYMATQMMGNVGDETIAMTPQGGATRAMPVTPGGGGLNTMQPTQAQQRTHIATDPEPEKKSKKGPIIAAVVAIIAIVAIAVSVFALNGQEDMETVPDVSDIALTQAQTQLREAGFEIGTVTEVYNADVTPGNVVSTSPAGGQKAKKGSTINITVSKGNESISVPDLSGKTRDQAMQELSSLGLSGSEGEAVFSDKPEGQVAQQDVASGTPVTRGTTIVFHLSKGVETIKIPSVTDKDKDAATDILENAGFKVKLKYFDSAEPAGTVVYQSQTGSAARGTTIELSVSNGSKTPDTSNPDNEDSSNSDNSGSNSGSGTGSGTGSGSGNSGSGSGSGSGSSGNNN